MPYKFQYIVNNQKKFEANLKKERCTHINPTTGNQCKRYITIGLPVCYQHLAMDDNLKIKKSTIPNGGKGLFAYDGTNDNNIVFKKDEKIAQYKGEHLNDKTLTNRYGDFTAPYAVKVKKNNFIDSAIERYTASLINSVKGTKKIKNVKLANPTNDGKIFVKTVKNIKNGEELLTSYGRDYKFNEPGVKSKTIYVK